MKLTTGEMIADAAKKWIGTTILWFMVLASIAPIC